MILAAFERNDFGLNHTYLINSANLLTVLSVWSGDRVCSTCAVREMRKKCNVFVLTTMATAATALAKTKGIDYVEYIYMKTTINVFCLRQFGRQYMSFIHLKYSHP